MSVTTPNTYMSKALFKKRLRQIWQKSMCGTYLRSTVHTPTKSYWRGDKTRATYHLFPIHTFAICTIVQSHGATGISDLTTVCTTTCPVPRTGGRISSIPRYLALDPVARHDHQSERFCEAIGANARFGYKPGCMQNFDDSMSNMRTSGGISVNGHGKNHRRKVWRPHRCVLLSTLHLHHYSAARIFRLGSVYSAYTGAMEEI